LPGNPVLVIGGTRSTGFHAAQLLHHGGIPVRVLARDRSAASRRLGPGFDIVQGDITRPDTLPPALSGVDHVIFTAGVRSGRFAHQSVVKATEYEGVLHTLAAARAQNFRGRFVYMTSIGVRRQSLFVAALNLWKGGTITWRHLAEDAIRASGIDYTVVRAAFLLNRPAGQREIVVRQTESPLTFREAIGRADVAEALVEALYHRCASRATFEVKWENGPRTSHLSELFETLKPDTLA
jgi:uncharacterized protein YbjT (DUF2867 family)